jgi:hypothetical protein
MQPKLEEKDSEFKKFDETVRKMPLARGTVGTFVGGRCF